MGRRRSEGRGGCQVQVGTEKKYLLPSGEILCETKGCPNLAKYECIESHLHYCREHKRKHGTEGSAHHWRRLKKLPKIVNEDPEPEAEESEEDAMA